jgi:hypothetical protein
MILSVCAKLKDIFNHFCAMGLIVPRDVAGGVLIISNGLLSA